MVIPDGVKEIAKGDLDKKLEIKTGDEIEVLACRENITLTAIAEQIDLTIGNDGR